jgi:SAM-dependent methyltransferase
MPQPSLHAQSEGDYILGTEDDEVQRLGLQHLVWRPRVTDAWRRAGFTVGQHIADIGCGPGYATVDLAGIVGRTGRVTAIDRSSRFLERVEQRVQSLALQNVDIVERDLDEAALPKLNADGAWCRWVFAFLRKPRELLRSIHQTLKAGGKLVIYEYFDYATWRLAPPRPDFEEFVQIVMKSWRENGGEPDIALDLVSWLPEEGFEIQELRPIVDLVSPADFIWQWPSTFVEVGLARLVRLGHIPEDRAAAVRDIFRAAEQDPNSRLVTPGVLEIIARRT